MADESLFAAVDDALRKGGVGKFPPDLEQLYDARRSQRRRVFLSRGMLAIGALLVITSGLDWLNSPELAKAAFAWRLLAGALCVAAALALLRVRRLWQETLLVVVPTLVLMVLTQLLGEWAPPRVADRYMIAAVGSAAAVIVTLPLRLVTARILAALAALAYPFALWWDPVALSLRPNLDLPAFACGILGTALLVARRNEALRRRGFLYRLRHDRTMAEMSAMNDQLARLSSTDGLTDLANRRSLDAEFRRLWHGGSPCDIGVVMLDIDHFKRFNDSAGHAAGDACLRQVAQALAGAVRRQQDLVARYGGEEFCVLLPGISRAHLLDMGERLRRAVADLEIPHPALSGRFVTVSVGLAWCDATARPDRPEALFQAADEALYAAKAAGRNGVAAAGLPGTRAGHDAVQG